MSENQVMALSADNIKAIYQNVLQRDPTQAESTSWTSVSNSGALTDTQIISAIVSSSEAQTVATVIRVYQAAFGRVPDKAGLDGWVDKLREGTPISSMVAGFVSSQEFANKYNGGKLVPNTGDAVNEAFLQALYINVLGRTATGAEIDAWMAELKKAGAYKNAGDILLGFSNSPEFVQKASDAITSFLTKAANSDSTIYKGPLLNPAVGSGQNFALTTAIDNIKGGSGNDTIVGDFTVANQVSVADQIDGGAGSDTLELYGAAGNLPTNIKNVETVNLSNFGDNKTLNFASYNDVKDVVLRNQSTQASGKSTVTLSGSQTLTIENVQDSGGSNNELLVASAASVAAQTIKLDKAGDAGSTGNDLEIEIGGTGVKTLNLQTQNNASRISLQDKTNGGDFAVETINITGDQNLSVDNIAASTAAKVTIAAGSFTGKLDLNLSAVENFEVASGKGDDRFNFGANFDGSDKVAGGDGTDTLATSNSAVNATLAGYIDGKTNGVANNSSIEVLEYTGPGPYTIDASLIQMASLKTYRTSAAITGTSPNNNGNTAGGVGVAVTGEANGQTFSFEANVTGGQGQGNNSTTASGGKGGTGVTFAPANNNGDNTVNVTLKGAVIAGGNGGANSSQTSGTTAAGGTGADFANFETINIVSTGATATAKNEFKGGTKATGGSGSTSGSDGASIVVSANAKLNVSGANEISLGTIDSNGQPVTVDASGLTGKLTVGTGNGSDKVIGGSGSNLITLSGGADEVDLSKSTAKADVVTDTSAFGTTNSSFVKIAGFTNAASTGDKLDLFGTTNASVQADVASGTATGVTNLTGSVSKGIMTFGGSAAATATLQNKIDAALSASFAASASKVVAFEHNGNTYVLGSDSSAGYQAGTDYIVELTGVTGLTTVSESASGANQLWIA